MNWTPEERATWKQRNTELEARIRKQQEVDPNQESEELPMKMTYTTPNGRMSFECEVTHAKQAFEVAAKISALFEEPDCGCCHTAHIQPEVRHVKDYVYYSLRCMECQAQLAFGQNKDSKGLFAKRWDQDNKVEMPNRGWFIWKPDPDKERAPASGSSAEPAAEEIPF